MDSIALPEMPRRTFMAIITGGLLAAPFVAQAQQTGDVYRIGFLGNSPRRPSRLISSGRSARGCATSGMSRAETS
jgi:hypothetical protein